MGETIPRAKAVTRKFGGLVANNNMSLSVKAGEILALIGPNGAGKSTMFNQLSGVDPRHLRRRAVPRQRARWPATARGRSPGWA